MLRFVWRINVAVFPTGRLATAKARSFVEFVEGVMRGNA
jgi:hypothetical protein